MVKVIFSLALSMALHGLLMFHNMSNPDVQKNETKQEKMKIKVIKRKNEKRQYKFKDYFSKIRTGSKSFNSDSYLVAKSGDIAIQKQMTLYSLIDNYIDYPEELAEHDIQGGVEAQFMLTKEGIYLEEFTRINSKSRYLKVYVARRLRKAFSELNTSKLKLKKMTKVKVLIFFHLTQSSSPFVKSSLYDNYIFLYRKRRGISTISDRAIHSVTKALGYVSNILTLINDLIPDSSKTKVKYLST